MSSRSQVSRTSCGISCRPWIRSASSSATAMSDPAPELHAARESRDAIGGDEDDRGQDEHGEPEDGDGGEIAALVEIEDEHREHLGLRGEEDHRGGQLSHDRDEDEAPGGDEARAEERGGHAAERAEARGPEDAAPPFPIAREPPKNPPPPVGGG